MPALNDPFWNVVHREDHEIQQLEKQVELVDQQLLVTNNSIALRSAGGFLQFVKSIESLHDHALRKLAKSKVSGVEELWELRGACRALSDVIALLTSDSAIGKLRETRAVLIDQLETLKKRRPQPSGEKQ